MQLLQPRVDVINKKQHFLIITFKHAEVIDTHNHYRK